MWVLFQIVVASPGNIQACKKHSLHVKLLGMLSWHSLKFVGHFFNPPGAYRIAVVQIT